MTKKPKLIYSIRAKLISAVAMLLVAVIMVVSSTYAWFTLSTAPEVTGITTQIGANGALEMALQPANGDLKAITTYSGTGSDAINLKNLTWGNLVDVSDSVFYGLNNITLYPSKLSATSGILDAATGAFLSVPEYGADGRIMGLSAENTLTGTWNGSSFVTNSDLGVRGVGTASGMTERQLIFRNARSAANTAMQQAKALASTSLNQNGSTLANIAVKRAVSTTSTYVKADVQALEKIVDDLLGYGEGDSHVTGSLEYIEEAYKQIILAYVAGVYGQQAGIEDDDIIDLKNGLAQLELSALMTTYGDNLPNAIKQGYEAYAATLTKVQNAKTNITRIYSFIDNVSTAASIPEAEVEVTWAAANSYTYTPAGATEATVLPEDTTGTHPGISATLNLLADTEAMEVNGIPASTIKDDDNMSKLVNSVASDGLKVTMRSKGGVYADIADHCGDYSASVVIEEISYNDLHLTNMNAKMETVNSNVITITPETSEGAGDAVTKTEPFLVYLSSVTEGMNPSSGDANETAAPITEMYGYVLDLAFKTNASESNLLLQTDAIDRIYGDNASDAQTMGLGSTMSFASTNVTKFTNEQVAELMKSLRIVFFNTASGQIYAYAKLDVAAMETYMEDGDTDGTDEIYYATDANGYLTANMYLYESVKTIKNLDANKNVVKVGTDGANTDEILYHYYNGSYYSKATPVYDTDETTITSYTYDEADKVADIYTETGVVVETKDEFQKGDEAIITALAQNEPQAVSVLVYLDGDEVGNEDVAADVATSMTGKMNVQFASSATLVPMEYSDLHVVAPSETKSVTPGTTTANIATGGATSYVLAKNAPAGWSVDNAGMVTIPAAATDGTSVKITAKDADGKTVKIWTIQVATATSEDDDAAAATEYNVTVPTGVTGNEKATANTDYTFTVDTANYTLGTVTVGGTAVTANPGENGAYTIPAASVTDDIVITVTENTGG